MDSPTTSLNLNLFLNSVISKNSSKFEDKFYFGFSFPVILKLSVKFYQSRIKALSRKLYNSTIFTQGSQKIASLPFLPIPEQSIWCLKVCNVKLFLRIPKPEFAQLNRWLEHFHIALIKAICMLLHLCTRILYFFPYFSSKLRACFWKHCSFWQIFVKTNTFQ